jgi:hypothetical protein
VEIISKDGRKFNFVLKDPPQCDQLKKHLRSCTFIDREKNSDLSHYVNNTFAHDFFTALLGNKLETSENGQIIASLNQVAWDTYSDSLAEFRR